MYYKYSVLSETGNEINGTEEGSFAGIKHRLKEKNFYILSLEPDILKSIRSSFARKKINAQTLSLFFEDLLNSLETGIAINEAVVALQESSNQSMVTRALSAISDDLSSGFSLTEAFKKTGVFPELVLNMLKVGEKSGRLEQVFKDLSLHYSREAEFLRSLKNAVIYPLVVFTLLVIVIFYVSFKVIPHLEALLPIGTNAYPATRVLLALSHFLKDFWFVCLLIPLAFVFIYSRLTRNPQGRLADYYYRIPLIGKIAKDIAFSAFFSNLAVLQRNGINIVESLSLIEETISYKFLAGKVSKIKDRIRSGFSFWQAVEKDPFFSFNVYTCIRKGEEMGILDKYLENLSRSYFNKVTREINLLLSFIQPALLVFCAGILMCVVWAFIIPVYGNLSGIAGGNVKF